MLYGLGLSAHAQNGALSWATRAGSNNIDEGNAVAVAADGTVYATGYFKSNATFGQSEPNQTILTSLSQDVFISKYATNGELIWVRQASGAAWGNAIGLDRVGNIYVFGHFSSQLTFNPGQPEAFVLTGFGQDVFLAKFDPDGICLWARNAGGSRNEYGLGISVDDVGNSYVTGRYGSNPATFGSGETNETMLPGIDGNNGEDIFVAKYDTNGLLQWARHAGGATGNAASGIGVDANGNCYVTGRYSTTATFGPGEANETVLVGPGSSYEIFVAKLFPNGNLAWVRGGQGQAEHDEGYAIAVDAAGNSYATGTYRSLAPFGGQLNPTQISRSGLDDLFVVKHDTDGNQQWVKMAVGPGSQFALGIALDPDDNAYITGYGSGLTLGAEEANEVALGGVGAQDIFVAKFDVNGLTQWAKLAGGNSDDRGQGIAFGAGGAHVIGRFGQTATFGAGEDKQTSLTSRGNIDIFVAKFQTSDAALLPPSILSFLLPPIGKPTINLSGTPFATYSIRRAATIAHPNWTTIGIIAIDANGHGVFQDDDPTLAFPVFYQIVGN